MVTSLLKNKYIGLILSTTLLFTVGLHNKDVYAKKDDGMDLEINGPIKDDDLSFNDGVVGEGEGKLVLNETYKEPLPDSGKKVFKYLKTNYSKLFKDSKGGNDVVYKKYDPVDFRTIYYGDSSAADKLQNNGKVGGYWRYIGVEYTNLDVTHNPQVFYDYCTDGTVLARSIINKPFSNTSSLHTSSNIIGNIKFDIASSVKQHYDSISNSKSAEVKAFKKKSGSDIREEWGKLIKDKYAEADNIKRNQKHSSCYKRNRYSNPGMTGDHIAFKWSNPSTKINYFHVTVPPTELTDGQSYEWHNSGTRYDGFRLSYKHNANFKAVSLTGHTTANIYAADFGVINTSDHDVDTGEGLTSAYEIKYNDVVLTRGLSPQAPIAWDKGEEKSIQLFRNVQLPMDMLNEDFALKAFFNPNKEDDFVETTYDDNVRVLNDTLSADIPDIPTNEFDATCLKGYMGTIKKYQNEETVEGSDETVCVDYSVALNHGIYVNTLTAKYTTLTAAWSSNSKGHHKYRKEIAAKDISKKDTYRANAGVRFSGKYAESKPITKAIRVPGIQKLGKVIRAGRSIEMYSGIALMISSESFSSTSAAKSQVENMKNYMLSDGKFVNRGDRVKGEGSGDYPLKNNKGKAESNAQIDKNRKLEVLNETTSTTKYGSDNCKTVTVYQARKTWFIPISTKNAGGTQKTKNGNFDPQSEYKVPTGKTKLFTSVDNIDGVYDVYFRNYLKPSILDGALSSADEFCDTTPEKVVIQGNIYDDVRAVEVKMETEDLGW